MKKIAIVASPVGAAWKDVGEDDATKTFVDPASIVRSGSTVRMASLLDYKSFQRMVEVGYFSQKSLAEYDCTDKKVRGLTASLHEGRMGEGKVIYEDDSTHEWEEIASDTLNEILWKFACK